MTAPITEQEPLSMTGFLQRVRLSFQCKQVETRPGLAEWGPDSRHFRIRLVNEDSGVRMTFHFSHGSAHTEPPTLPDVLECLAADASLIENADSFEEFASAVGGNEDSRKEHANYRACVRQTEALKALLGTDYATLLWEVQDR